MSLRIPTQRGWRGGGRHHTVSQEGTGRHSKPSYQKGIEFGELPLLRNKQLPTTIIGLSVKRPYGRSGCDSCVIEQFRGRRTTSQNTALNVAFLFLSSFLILWAPFGVLFFFGSTKTRARFCNHFVTDTLFRFYGAVKKFF